MIKLLLLFWEQDMWFYLSMLRLKLSCYFLMSFLKCGVLNFGICIESFKLEASLYKYFLGMPCGLNFEAYIYKRNTSSNKCELFVKAQWLK